MEGLIFCGYAFCMPAFRCPLCASNGYVHVGKTKRVEDILSCAGCSVVFTDSQRLTKCKPSPAPFTEDYRPHILKREKP